MGASVLLRLFVAGAAAAPLQPEGSLGAPQVPKHKPKSLSNLRQSQLAGCTDFASASGDPTMDTWCQQSCAAGNCNEGLCKCSDPNFVAAGQQDAGPSFQEQLEKREDLQRDNTKVDQKGQQGLPFKHAIIGYWGAGPYTPFDGGAGPDEGPSVADALKQGYNVICVSFGDQFTVDGDFKIDTDMCPANREMLWKDRYHPCLTDKFNISKEAGMPVDSWRYVLSFGGAAGPGPYMPAAETPEEREKIENTFVDGFVATYLKTKQEYGFDGIDIDVESSLSTPLLSAFRKIFKKLNEKGEIISMAPESPILDPGNPAYEGEDPGLGAHNSYTPLVDTSVINHVSWVAPQLYNDLIPFGEDPAKYVESLSSGLKVEWDGRLLEIRVPPNKIVLGHPATNAAAPARKPPEWQSDPMALAAKYKASPTLMATKGVMTWSVGHDYSNDWKWVKAMKTIWDD
jgi:chitinase